MLRVLEPPQHRHHREGDQRHGEHALGAGAVPVPPVGDRSAEGDEGERGQVLGNDRGLGQDSPCPCLRPCSTHVAICSEISAGVTLDFTRYSIAPSERPRSIIDGSP